MSFESYLEKSLYPSGMDVSIGTVPTPSGLDPPKIGAPNGTPDTEPQITGMTFEVTIDGHDLGFWSKVDGLAVKFEMAEYRAGDGNNYRWIEPAYTTYQNVKLGRVTTLKYTNAIMDWLQATQFKSEKVTASIKGYPFWHNKRDASLAVQWNLTGVLPVAWSGPQFDSQSGKVAVETLELAHEGFLKMDG
jgi:phage tail-like protein